MTKAEHLRLVTWRSRILQYAAAESRAVAQTCRYFGISRKTYYKWRGRFRSHGAAGLSDRSRAAQRCPRATPARWSERFCICASSTTLAPAALPRICSDSTSLP